MEDNAGLLIYQQIDNEYHECFICLETQKTKEIPIQLKNQTIFLKFCQCDGWIHDSCLKVWFNINEKCPICRNKMLKNITLELECGFYIYYYFYIITKIVNKFIENIVRFRNFFIFCVIISNIMNIVSNCVNKYEYTNEYYFPSESHYSEPLENRIIPFTN